MSRHYDDNRLCRYCRRQADEHKAFCPLAPVPPDLDDPAVEPDKVSTAESRYTDGLHGEPGGWR
jgi:hypothetical protein